MPEYINGKRNVTRCQVCGQSATGCTLRHTPHAGIFPAVGLCDAHLAGNLRARQENAERVLAALIEFETFQASLRKGNDNDAI